MGEFEDKSKKDDRPELSPGLKMSRELLSQSALNAFRHVFKEGVSTDQEAVEKFDAQQKNEHMMVYANQIVSYCLNSDLPGLRIILSSQKFEDAIIIPALIDALNEKGEAGYPFINMTTEHPLPEVAFYAIGVLAPSNPLIAAEQLNKYLLREQMASKFISAGLELGESIGLPYIVKLRPALALLAAHEDPEIAGSASELSKIISTATKKAMAQTLLGFLDRRLDSDSPPPTEGEQKILDILANELKKRDQKKKP